VTQVLPGVMAVVLDEKASRRGPEGREAFVVLRGRQPDPTRRWVAAD
jgi:hypothetical protein